MTGGSAVTHGQGYVVSLIRHHGFYSLSIHTSLVGQCAVTQGPGAVVQTIGHMPYIHCTFILDMTAGSAVAPGQVPVVPTIRHHSFNSLPIHICLHGCFSRASYACANNMRTCRMILAYSHYSWRIVCRHSRASTRSFNNKATWLIFIAEWQYSWRTVLQSLMGEYPYCQQYCVMSYIYCPFTLVFSYLSALTQGPVPEVWPRPPHALSLPHSHQSWRTMCPH